LSETAFRRLLEWLDAGNETSGESYLEMRRRLTAYFDRKGCSAADELADETLNRVARRLEETGNIVATAPAQYCYTVARFVFLEQLQRPGRDPVSLDSLSEAARARVLGDIDASGSDQRRIDETRLECLQRCLAQSEARDRELITQYYHGDQRSKIENRQSLAARLEISPNALSIRTCRIRSRLETCVRRCVELAQRAPQDRV
jgi:DNA-directed RNA polymerase specialized sigma24 family protein